MISLNKPAGGDTDWTTEINDNWTTLENRAVDANTVTAKGDLLVATGSATIVRVGVGTNDQVLTADSTQAAGVKWATPGAGSEAAANKVLRFERFY